MKAAAARTRGLAALALALTWGACKDERPIRTGESRPTRRAETRDIVVEVIAPSSSAGTAPDAATDASVAPEVAGEASDAVQRVPEAVTDDLCRTACQNALRLTLAELPESASSKMREEIGRALEVDCPKRCVERGSLASVRCIESAKTALELAACPR